MPHAEAYYICTYIVHIPYTVEQLYVCTYNGYWYRWLLLWIQAYYRCWLMFAQMWTWCFRWCSQMLWFPYTIIKAYISAVAIHYPVHFYVFVPLGMLTWAHQTKIKAVWNRFSLFTLKSVWLNLTYTQLTLQCSGKWLALVQKPCKVENNGGNCCSSRETLFNYIVEFSMDIWNFACSTLFVSLKQPKH